MKDIKESVRKLAEDLKQERDEIILKLHLGKEDLEDEWEELEKKMQQMELKAKEIQATASEASEDVISAARLLGDELKKGYKKVRKKL